MTRYLIDEPLGELAVRAYRIPMEGLPSLCKRYPMGAAVVLVGALNNLIAFFPEETVYKVFDFIDPLL